jgi:hypothetical protein
MRSPTRLPRGARAALVLALLLTAGLTPAGIASTAAADFPAADSRYHSYAEMVAEIKAVAAAKPSIVKVFSIGTSYQGRTLWAAKISDNVGTDETEPEIMFDALHHAREHFTLEQALYLLRVLANGYDADERVTKIVQSREIWIVFALNPDGAEYDITGPKGPRGPYRAWRKNRQPTPGSTSVGTDLNRNYDYRWACCGGSSGSPSNLMYRGPKAFSAPETRALRDFVNSRVRDGRQQIKAHITFHTNGQLILWPYGYTYTDVPTDMTTVDHDALVAFAKGQASRNGYRAQQSSQLYITDGDQIDWMYGRHRIFSYTWELYPPETATVWGDHYPPDERIAEQTARNRSALLYFIEQGGCPYSVLGAATTKTHCGPLMDDAEISRGWARDAGGSDTATSGVWQRGDPEQTSVSGRIIQPGTQPSGRYTFVTGAATKGAASANDLDGGVSTLRSPAIRLPTDPGDLTFRWFFGTRNGVPEEDRLQASIIDTSGERHVVFERLATPGGDSAVWTGARISLDAFAGQSIRMEFRAMDGGADDLVEAGVDDIRIERP